jgi:transcriptional regulator with XRE-family HTH domain
MRKDMTMNQRLKTVRTTLGFTQAGFAEHLGITQTAYSMIENGFRPLSAKYVKLLVSTFGVSEEWLTAGNGQIFASSPYKAEFSTLFDGMTEEHQRILLNLARELYRLDTGKREITK